MNSLALELIDEIIGHPLSPACLLSLVCRLWLPLSQRRPFHHISFRADPREMDAEIQ
ncbi:hypothetical protein JB92DRAFT_2992191 [Gautieria morchelliformis]|nr:hypothetical protein JB92DRAFT_2992191 [Gautieria morchelliformis]